MGTVNIEQRSRINVDPHHNRYKEVQWTAWELLEIGVDEGRCQSRLRFWRDLNDFAVEHRGEKARKEFRIKQPSNMETKK